MRQRRSQQISRRCEFREIDQDFAQHHDAFEESAEQEVSFSGTGCAKSDGESSRGVGAKGEDAGFEEVEMEPLCEV